MREKTRGRERENVKDEKMREEGTRGMEGGCRKTYPRSEGVGARTK